MYAHTIKSTPSLRGGGTVVVRLPPSFQTRHVLNGRIVKQDSDICAEVHSSSEWDPFRLLETSNDFFYTYIKSSPDEYAISIFIPEYISRYVRVQKGQRVIAVVGEAMARRRWYDLGTGANNVHEQWRVYSRLFKVPHHADIRKVRAEYSCDTVNIIIPKRVGRLYNIVKWIEERLWFAKQI